MTRVHYSECPVCSSKDIELVLNVKDHTVSCEDYAVFQCNNCSLRFTQNVPGEADIIPYYKSPDYISHSNTNKGIVNRLYQFIRKYTLESKARLVIRATKPKGNLLDLGAGIGAFLHTIEARGWMVNGIEPDQDARQQALNLFKISISDLQGLNQFPAKSFDAITMWHVLEHVHQLHPYIEHLNLLLKDDGKIFIAVPNYQSLDASVYKNNWAAYDVPRHLYHFTPKAMEVLINKHGMKVSAKKPMWFDSFYISLMSSKYRNGKINWLAAITNGLRSNLKTLENKDYCSSLIYIISKN